MSDISWIKLKTEMFADDKIRLIESMPEADAIILIWIKLLTQAGKTNANGYIFLNEQVPFTEEMLSTIFNRPLNTVRLALKTLQEFGMIDIDEKGFIMIENWDKHQNIEGMEKIREQSKIRMRKSRAKRKLISEGCSEQEAEDICNRTDFNQEEDVTQQLRNITHQNKNKSKNKNIYTVFDYWNEQQIIQHRKLKDKTESKINSYLTDYSVDEINTSISNYKAILDSPDYYFDYKWTLDDFLQRGLEKFLDLETAKSNYRNKQANKNSHKEELINEDF